MNDVILDGLIHVSESLSIAETSVTIIVSGLVITGIISPTQSVIQDAFMKSLGEDASKLTAQIAGKAQERILNLTQVELLTPSGTVLKMPYLRISLDAVSAWAGKSPESLF